MLDEITPEQFQEWIAYDHVEPLRADREKWPQDAATGNSIERFQNAARAMYGRRRNSQR